MSTSAERLVGEPLSCREFVELVTDYFEGALADALRLRFEEHLATCPDCPRYLRQIEETVRLTGRLTEETIPMPARAELLRAFRDWHRRGG